MVSGMTGGNTATQWAGGVVDDGGGGRIFEQIRLAPNVNVRAHQNKNGAKRSWDFTVPRVICKSLRPVGGRGIANVSNESFVSAMCESRTKTWFHHNRNRNITMATSTQTRFHTSNVQHLHCAVAVCVER